MDIPKGFGLAPKTIFCDPDLSIGAKALAGLLLSHQGNETCSWPSISVINRLLGVSGHTTYRYLKELEKKPYFKRMRRKGKSQKFANNVYSFDFNQLLPTKITLQEEEPYEPFVHTENGEKPNKKPYAHFPHAEKPHAENDHTKNNMNKKNMKDIYTCWNESKIIVHRQMDKKIERRISSSLKAFPPDEIKKSIKNYKHVLDNPEQFYFTHRYTLARFLEKGIEQFHDDSKPFENFRKHGTQYKPVRDQSYYQNGGKF